MPESQQIYTYRAGQKIILDKKPDQFVVRALPDELRELGITDAEQVSSTSSRVTTRSVDLEPMMSESRHLAPTHHAYTMADTGEELLISDRVIVTFREPPSVEQLADFTGRYALILKEAYTDRDFLFQLTDDTGMNPIKLVVKLTEEEPLVEMAENDLNYRMNTYQLSLPTDPSYVRQWHLHAHLVNEAFDPRASSRCEEAWQLLHHFGSSDVVIGVTDDGCKLDHLDFDAPGKFASWGYFRGERLITQTDIDADPAQMYKSGANHGTSCAGVIAGEADAVLTVGAAPGCRLLPIQWESSGPSLFISDSKLMTALNYVADKVDVLSNSWGSVPTTLWSSLVRNRITDLAQSGGRRGRGILFLWAAGNEDCPIQHTTTINVPYTNGWERRADGSLHWIGVTTSRRFQNNLVGIPGLMHIAALASNAQRSHYSNYGTGIALCAPTNNRHRFLRLTVTGLGITTTTGTSGGVTTQFGGTSSATPLVAGIAALVISANPDLTAIEVAALLKQTASKDLSFEGYPPTPPASFDPDPVWDVSPIAPFDQGEFTETGDADGSWSPWFGSGRVDAFAAVREALRRKDTIPQQTMSQASAPALKIPDNQEAGISDTIRFAEAVTLTSLKVEVDITHTYIGDLRVSLTAPSGKNVELHNRNGGNADDLKRTYDLSTTPGLGILVGDLSRGEWKLLVQDLARLDRGTLNRWALEFTGQADVLVELSEAPGVKIPDNNAAGIERTLASSADGRVGEVEVTLDITHTYIGDLVVALVSPAGSNVVLHKRSGGSVDNLIKTYTLADTAGLLSLRGQEIQGDWKLQIADIVAADTGKLNRWSLKIKRQSG
jgi:subtilisin-like proprotein convertase family protein/subtilisin family serine protease